MAPGASQLPQHGFSHWYAHQSGGGPYRDAPMVRDGELVAEPGYITDKITDDALSFLDAHARDGAPWYLSVHYTAPHSPWTGHPQEIVDSYDDCPFVSCPQEPRHPWATSLTDRCLGDREMLKGYFAAVTAMDANVGRLLDRLDALGLAEETLVVFRATTAFPAATTASGARGTAPSREHVRTDPGAGDLRHPGLLGGSVQGRWSRCRHVPDALDYLGLPAPEGRTSSGDPSSRPPRRAVRRAGGGGHYDEYGDTRMIRTAEWKYVRRYPEGAIADSSTIPTSGRTARRPRAGGAGGGAQGADGGLFARHVRPEVDGRRQGVTGSAAAPRTAGRGRRTSADAWA